ncbi:MAG: hypothetical protein JSU70_08460 [Phycisphaerales bacterium]|nr:MAG: hypothetical protein JSU70_08460 [Phycisphaerales bacterium]
MAKALARGIVPVLIILLACTHTYGVRFVLNEEDSNSRFQMDGRVSAGEESRSSSLGSIEPFFKQSAEYSIASPESSADADLNVGFRCVFEAGAGEPKFDESDEVSPWPVEMDMSLLIGLDGSGSVHHGYDEVHEQDEYGTFSCDLSAQAKLCWNLLPDQPEEYEHMPVRVLVWANHSLYDWGFNVARTERSFITNLEINDGAVGPLYAYSDRQGDHQNQWFGPNPLDGGAIFLPLGEVFKIEYAYEFHLKAPYCPCSDSDWDHPLEPTDLYVCAKAEPGRLLYRLSKPCLRAKGLLNNLQSRTIWQQDIESALVDIGCTDPATPLILALDVAAVLGAGAAGDTEDPNHFKLTVLSPDGKDNGHLIGEGQDFDEDNYDDTPRIAEGIFTQTWCAPAQFGSLCQDDVETERPIPIQIDVDRDGDGDYDYAFVEYITLVRSTGSIKGWAWRATRDERGRMVQVRPLDREQVTITAQGDWCCERCDSLARSCRTDSDGSFVFEDVEPGFYNVQIEGWCEGLSGKKVQVGPGSTVTLWFPSDMHIDIDKETAREARDRLNEEFAEITQDHELWQGGTKLAMLFLSSAVAANPDGPANDAAAALAESFGTDPWTDLIVGALAEATGRETGLLNDMAEDPPDPNYAEVFEPYVPETITLPADYNGVFTDSVVQLVNLLAAQASLEEAILISLERCHGALLAEDVQSVTLQVEAMGNFSSLMMENAEQLEQSAAAVKADIEHIQEDTAQVVEQFQGRLHTGFTSSEEQALRDMGLGDEDLERYRQLLLRFSFGMVVAGLDDLAVVSASRAESASLLLGRSNEVLAFLASFDFDLRDLTRLADYWLANCTAPDWCCDCDANTSGAVDFLDLAILTAPHPDDAAP